MSYLDDEAQRLKEKRDRLRKALEESKDVERILLNRIWMSGGMEGLRAAQAELEDDDEDWDDEDDDWDDDDFDDDYDDDWDDDEDDDDFDDEDDDFD